MIIRLCKVGLGRLGPPGLTRGELLDAIRERGDTPVVADCLDRCTPCEKGQLVATVDGIPVSVQDGAALLKLMEEIAAD